MKNKPLILGTALLFSSALFVNAETVYGEEATTPGKYKMTYEVDGKVETVTVEVKENQTELLLQDIIINQNETWSPLDNVVLLKGKDGQPLSIDQVTIKNNVNTQETGTYFVKFSYEEDVAIAKVSVNPFTSSTRKKRVIDQNSPNDSRTKIMLNDELLKDKPTQVMLNVNTSGGGNRLGSTDFGNMLSFLSGTLLYGTRRV
ncbi:bacterial Ig-like domain-containing protein [Enterococcus rotai]|uniref:bacterial Ig-like domain-containing protein n=1 Tax=Enterococcus rotai TaxID=118060 RepID=UPI0032B49F45